MKPAIIALGVANPPYTRAEAGTADFIAQAMNLKPVEKRILRSVYKSTGIETRYSVLQDYSAEVGRFTFFPNEADAPWRTTGERLQIYKDHALTLALAAIDNAISTLGNF